MSLHDADTRHGLSRPRGRAPTALVSGVAALLAFGPTAFAGSPALDTDCDGVVDANDDCRAVAEDRDGHDDGDGCPDPDNDGDRIADGADQCPDEAEVVNDFQDVDGCPDRAVEVRKARASNRRVEFLIEFALVRRSRAGAVREAARARASFRSAFNHFRAQAEPGCMPVSPVRSERANRTATGGFTPVRSRRAARL